VLNSNLIGVKEGEEVKKRIIEFPKDVSRSRFGNTNAGELRAATELQTCTLLLIHRCGNPIHTNTAMGKKQSYNTKYCRGR
jgi:hypothetical protein